MSTRGVDRREVPRSEYVGDLSKTITKTVYHLGDKLTSGGYMNISLPRFKFLDKAEPTE